MLLRRVVAGVLFALALVLPSVALGGDTTIVVYNKGKTIRYDPEVGADLKEVTLETWDYASGKKAKVETIEAYFHLSEDKEIITPDQITDDCRTRFIVEKKGDKYFFGGVREKAATIEEANAAAPAPTRADAVNALETKVKKISKEVVKVDPEKPGSANVRARLITAEFTTALRNFTDQELNDVAGFVLNDPALDDNQRYYVLRSFGFTFYDQKDFHKSIFFYEKCTELNPANYSAYLQKAVAHEKAQEPERAMKAFARALALKPREGTWKYFMTLVQRTNSTEHLDMSKMDELKGKLDQVQMALKAKDSRKATEEAEALETQLGQWLGGAGGSTPPKRPAPAPTPPRPAPPSGEPASTPPPSTPVPQGDPGDATPLPGEAPPG